MFLEFSVDNTHDIWIHNLIHFWSVSPHLWLYLMQLTLAIGYYLDDVIKCVTISTLELNTYKFRIAVNAMQSFHLFHLKYYS